MFSHAHFITFASMVRRMLKLKLSIQPGEASQKWTQANQQIAQVKLADQVW